ncbi:hypothetical protein [Pseudonocardia oroxyli]|uniref:Uncharacterized protein n=1 Tax=Pseudonocardia oroxyli TaxID=366584 RepID=A0A1G7PW09_PSEOR|nr:hypothetical protein [Pseudonocardia oroxyli]SDF90507.1 hypothetical protein SAMN05216377_107258 [Pseudonocardia oroxyli]
MSAVDGPIRAELTFIGTATTLLRLGEFTVLTDPNLLRRGERVHLGYGLTSRRRTSPARTLDALPDLDTVLLSHLHGTTSTDGLGRVCPGTCRSSPPRTPAGV